MMFSPEFMIRIESDPKRHAGRPYAFSQRELASGVVIPVETAFRTHELASRRAGQVDAGDLASSR